MEFGCRLLFVCRALRCNTLLCSSVCLPLENTDHGDFASAFNVPENIFESMQLENLIWSELLLSPWHICPRDVPAGWLEPAFGRRAALEAVAQEQRAPRPSLSAHLFPCWQAAGRQTRQAEAEQAPEVHTVCVRTTVPQPQVSPTLASKIFLHNWLN